MITIYAAEVRGGYIKMTTDRDCLPPDAIHTSTRIFPNMDAILATAEMYFNRGFSVDVDTESGLVQYEH